MMIEVILELLWLPLVVLMVVEQRVHKEPPEVVAVHRTLESAPIHYIVELLSLVAAVALVGKEMDLLEVAIMEYATLEQLPQHLVHIVALEDLLVVA